MNGVTTILGDLQIVRSREVGELLTAARLQGPLSGYHAPALPLTTLHAFGSLVSVGGNFLIVRD